MSNPLAVAATGVAVAPATAVKPAASFNSKDHAIFNNKYFQLNWTGAIADKVASIESTPLRYVAGFFAAFAMLAVATVEAVIVNPLVGAAKFAMWLTGTGSYGKSDLVKNQEKLANALEMLRTNLPAAEATQGNNAGIVKGRDDARQAADAIVKFHVANPEHRGDAATILKAIRLEANRMVTENRSLPIHGAMVAGTALYETNKAGALAFVNGLLSSSAVDALIPKFAANVVASLQEPIESGTAMSMDAIVDFATQLSELAGQTPVERDALKQKIIDDVVALVKANPNLLDNAVAGYNKFADAAHRGGVQARMAANFERQRAEAQALLDKTDATLAKMLMDGTTTREGGHKVAGLAGVKADTKFSEMYQLVKARIEQLKAEIEAAGKVSKNFAVGDLATGKVDPKADAAVIAFNKLVAEQSHLEKALVLLVRVEVAQKAREDAVQGSGNVAAKLNTALEARAEFIRALGGDSVALEAVASADAARGEMATAAARASLSPTATPEEVAAKANEILAAMSPAGLPKASSGGLLSWLNPFAYSNPFARKAAAPVSIPPAALRA